MVAIAEKAAMLYSKLIVIFLRFINLELEKSFLLKTAAMVLAKNAAGSQVKTFL